MKVTNGKTIVMQTLGEAFNVWIRPEDYDYQAGGRHAIRYAGWDYLGIDPSVSLSESGVELVGATKHIESFYDRLCDGVPLQSGEEIYYDFDSGEHSFPEGFSWVKVLDAYREDPTNFTLEFCETVDTGVGEEDLFMEITNKTNRKKLQVSVVSENAYIRQVFFILLGLFENMQREKAVELPDQSDLVDDFLAD